jgi:hypothetical protein
MTTNKNVSISLVGLIIITGFYGWLVKIHSGEHWHNLNLLTNVVLFATLWAIIIYTWKTWQLKDLTSKQIANAIRPFVVFHFHNRIIENIGNGVALNIQINRINVKDCKPDSIFTSTNIEYISFDTINYLKNKSEPGMARLHYWNKDNEEIQPNSTVGNAIFEGTNRLTAFKMSINYTDIDGKPYLTKMEIRNGYFQVT